METLPEKVQRYADRITEVYGRANSELVTARKQIAEQQLLQAPQKHKKGKRIALKGKFVFTTEEVLEVARTAEADTAARKAKKQPRKHMIDKIDSEKEERILGDDCGSDLDCVIVAVRR